jgi:ribosomal protein S18 acetylase RimI-like enzyme
MAPDNSENILILDYKAKYRRDFKELNYEWLEKYFTVEPYDELVLSDPEGKIIKLGGCVLFAQLDGTIVGTCALLKHTDRKYELAKMGVSEKYRGRKIGRTLCQAAIDRAKRLGAHKLVLATSPRLEAANYLYQRMGFKKADLSEIGPLPYGRHSICMVLNLDAI